MPTRTMGEEDKDYALSFAIPADTKGVTYVFSRQTNDTRRLDGVLDAGNPKYGIVGGEALIIFKDVFVPWERVFMAGEYDFTNKLVETFAGYHRSNYGGCKVGLADVVIGGSNWVAEAHGIANASHIIDKLTEMIAMAETCWSCTLACSYEGYRTPSGAYHINPLLANVTKLNITRMVYEWMRVAQDIAGGKIITLPSEKDLDNPESGKIIEECFSGKEGFPPLDIIKMLRLIENMSVGAGLPEAMLARTVKEINREIGITILITEQYARPIFPIIDYGYVLENGGAVLEGTAKELMENPDVKSAYFGL
jgi:4-hydroxybutyryl-CoA dehydratase/vinylacetyl-CoA-Delta-isomerase